jgi:antitoxin ParD1/3/4
VEPAEEISVTVSAEMLHTIRASVAAGEYGSTSEAIRDAVRLWQRQRLEDAERLNVIRARIRRSLDDPRPDLTLEEVDAHLEAVFTRAKQTGGNAAA